MQTVCSVAQLHDVAVRIVHCPLHLSQQLMHGIRLFACFPQLGAHQEQAIKRYGCAWGTCFLSSRSRE